MIIRVFRRERRKKRKKKMSLWMKDQLGFTKDQHGGSSLLVQSNGVAGEGARVGIVSSPGGGSFPPVMWVRASDGKRDVNVVQPDAGGGPFAAGAGVHINIAVTGLTTAADTVSSAIVVNTTRVTANSRIQGNVISYAGTYGTNGVPQVLMGAIVAGTSFSFYVYNAHGSNALSGTILIAFTIEN
jgi:hypothetical protein